MPNIANYLRPWAKNQGFWAIKMSLSKTHLYSNKNNNFSTNTSDKRHDLFFNFISNKILKKRFVLTLTSVIKKNFNSGNSPLILEKVAF